MREDGSNIILTAKEKKIIELIRATGYGELKIIIQNNEPVRIEEITRSLKL
ncbi:DUF2292 domain-containing protein [Desulfosporosinus sp. PR]|uniref:DUF2292 domain-containing protein n=1 Tax=Candidatus Desulfosporosinus nitrosoreducens TaxID=3401928 RepID=UPI0027F00A76|nr:DUF2292 domain-containing protein [Desulfosporosinus sp. PR]MDQ7094898.1 DUF2292 domain-containing protein [Desulfosporosinus sp. PR]